jgi:hypothetical protein
MMGSSTNIRFLSRDEIDTGKWDHCILHAPNGLIYARSFYLDSMAKNWSALVLNDYEMVMPLTWNRKFGISYLYQPAFTAQLGIFFRDPPENNIFKKFIDQAKSHFSFCEIHLNFANPANENQVRTNYILDLGKPYTEIRRGYKKRLLENLREAESNHLQYQASDDYKSAISLFKSQYGERFSHVKQSDYQQFEILCRALMENRMIFVRKVKDETGELLNTSIFFRDTNRIYNIMSVTLKAGREKKAHFFLLDQLIMEYATKNLLFDFEGSEIPGIAEFYRKFGTINQPYPFLRFNRLPFPLRFFKKRS